MICSLDSHSSLTALLSRPRRLLPPVNIFKIALRIHTEK